MGIVHPWTDLIGFVMIPAQVPGCGYSIQLKLIPNFALPPATWRPCPSRLSENNCCWAGRCWEVCSAVRGSKWVPVMTRPSPAVRGKTSWDDENYLQSSSFHQTISRLREREARAEMSVSPGEYRQSNRPTVAQTPPGKALAQQIFTPDQHYHSLDFSGKKNIKQWMHLWLDDYYQIWISSAITVIISLRGKKTSLDIFQQVKIFNLKFKCCQFSYEET